MDHSAGAAQTEGPAQTSLTICWIIWTGLHRRRDEHIHLTIFAGSFGHGCTDAGTSTDFCQQLMDHSSGAAQKEGPAQTSVNS